MSEMTVQEIIDGWADSAVERLLSFLRIPSISTDPAYTADVERCAEFVLARMREAGLDSRRLEGEGHPLLYGERLVGGDKPTVLFYGHYDVQPPDPLDEWRGDPFEPLIDGDRIIARGATDDKGQFFAHLEGIAALAAARDELPVNVKFIIEGEEETGGWAIERFVREDRGELLSCDGVVVSDGPMYAAGRPSVVYGLRGIAYAEIHVTGPDRDLHSGHWGGVVSNPLNALAQVLAQLQDPVTGQVRLPGFYDAVRPLEPWEQEMVESLELDKEQTEQDLGVPELWGEPGRLIQERRWTRPTLDVHGIWGGYQGEGGKTVIARSAGAKLSMRLVPDQDHELVLESLSSYVAEIAPPGVRVEVVPMSSCEPMLADPQGPVMEAAVGALEEIWNQKPVLQRHGGSIPIVSTFLESLQVPVVLVGYGLPDDGPHSPNEKFHLTNFVNGMKVTASLLERLGAAD